MLPSSKIIDMVENLEYLEWQYHAEGNANIILKNLKYNLVLRVKKINKRKIPVGSFEKIDNFITVEQEIDFINLVLKPLLKERDKYMPEVYVKMVSERFVRKISNLIEKDRPKHRKIKNIEYCEQLVLVLPFLCVFPCISNPIGDSYISVEIKPKCGFLPFSSFISATHEIKKSVCRFCLHQTTKLQTGKIKELSEYCPLDLYGDCLCRVEFALKSLFKTPQNNIALSVNGKRIPMNDIDDILCHSSLYNNKEELESIIANIFFHDSKNNLSVAKRKHAICINSNFKTHQGTCQKLDNGGVLNLLSELQCLDTLDIEYIATNFRKVLSKTGFEEEDFCNFKSPLWQNIVSNNKDDSALTNLDNEIADAVSMRDICKYLISNTFKDCSIILTFCKVKEDQSQAIDNDIQTVYDENLKSWFNYQIKLVDFDPRIIQNIPHYGYLDHEIVSTYCKEKTGESCCL